MPLIPSHKTDIQNEHIIDVMIHFFRHDSVDFHQNQLKFRMVQKEIKTLSVQRDAI